METINYSTNKYTHLRGWDSLGQKMNAKTTNVK